MSKRTGKLMIIDLERFLAATNQSYMSERLREINISNGLFKINIEQVLVSRVMPGNFGGFSIQYIIRLENYIEDQIMYGYLLGQNEKEPTYFNQNERTIFLSDIRMILFIFPFDPK